MLPMASKNRKDRNIIPRRFAMLTARLWGSIKWLLLSLNVIEHSVLTEVSSQIYMKGDIAEASHKI